MTDWFFKKEKKVGDWFWEESIDNLHPSEGEGIGKKKVQFHSNC